MTFLLFTKRIAVALRDPKRRWSTLRHPFWCAKFYWKHARKSTALRRFSKTLSLDEGLAFWNFECEQLAKAVSSPRRSRPASEKRTA